MVISFLNMTINFIYNNQKYPIELKYLNKETDYFCNERLNDENTQIDLYLINEFDNTNQFSTNIITNFINYFKTKKLELTPDNIFSMSFLINKYKITKLKVKTSQYINENYKQLIDNFFNKYKSQNKKEITKEEEKLISKHIIEYLNDDRLILLPTHVLYRIFDECSSERQRKKKNLNAKSNLQTKPIQKLKETDDDNDDKEEEEDKEKTPEKKETKTIKKAKPSKSKTKTKTKPKQLLKKKVQKPSMTTKKTKLTKIDKD